MGDGRMRGKGQCRGWPRGSGPGGREFVVGASCVNSCLLPLRWGRAGGAKVPRDLRRNFPDLRMACKLPAHSSLPHCHVQFLSRFFCFSPLGDSHSQPTLSISSESSPSHHLTPVTLFAVPWTLISPFRCILLPDLPERALLHQNTSLASWSNGKTNKLIGAPGSCPHSHCLLTYDLVYMPFLP